MLVAGHMSWEYAIEGYVLWERRIPGARNKGLK
jgi:hypothetical protein